MDLKSFKTDPALDEGAWLALGDAEIKIARLGSPRYQSAVTRRLKPHRESLELGVMSDADAQKITIELLADFILLDWKGVELDGKPLPYSRENAIQALGIEVFRTWVQEQARDLENFRAKETAEAVESVAKN
jgi:hypothetical protein